MSVLHELKTNKIFYKTRNKTNLFNYINSYYVKTKHELNKYNCVHNIISFISE